MNPKQAIWHFLPGFMKKGYLNVKTYFVDILNINNSEKVFTNIYQNDLWGKKDDGFCSGIGSVNEFIVSNYIATIGKEAEKWEFRDKTFVDLGCGDFRVGKQLAPLCSKYIAVDVVKPLIENNIKKYASADVEFHHMDIIEDELPKGDVCFIRQVLQHLSNQQIKEIIEKLDQYTWVYITEHLPNDGEAVRPNINKIPDGKIRLSNQSGVYLSKPPFNLPVQHLSTILEVPAAGKKDDYSAGVIRTVLYMPGE